MTTGHNEPDVLTMYRTTPGNHARGHLNQRQIDVIREEVLPRLKGAGYQSIGIIAPYRDQVAAIRTQLGNCFDVATVHKFQGREKDAIILTSVDNIISDFVDDPRMLNVAVSRAVKSLTIVTSQDPRNDKTNYGELARYIEYNNCAVIESAIYSVFDLLYQGYAQQRRAFASERIRIRFRKPTLRSHRVNPTNAGISQCGLRRSCIVGQYLERLLTLGCCGDSIRPKSSDPCRLSSIPQDG